MPKSYKVELEDFTWEYILNRFDLQINSMKEKMEVATGQQKILLGHLLAVATGYKQEILRGSNL